MVAIKRWCGRVGQCIDGGKSTHGAVQTDNRINRRTALFREAAIGNDHNVL